MKRNTLSWSLAAFFVLAGCLSSFGKVTEETWNERFAKTYCQYSKRCMALYFFYEYDDVAECAEEYEETLEDQSDWYDDCSFDEDEAQDCLDALNESCQSIGEDEFEDLEACGKVWDCGRNGQSYSNNDTGE